MEMVLDSFKSELSDFFTTTHDHEGDPYILKFHISHTDMDGYGCTVLSSLVNIALNPIQASMWVEGINDIIHVNTSKLGKDFPAEFIAILKRYIPSDLKFSSTFVEILITDIQTDVDELYAALEKGFKDYFGDRPDFIPPYFNILVIDHHQWDRPEYDQNYEKVYHGTPNEAELNYRAWQSKDRPDFDAVRIWTYVNHNFSATKLLNNMIIESEVLLNARISVKRLGRLVSSMSLFSTNVSKYDTGKWGNWYCDDENKFSNTVTYDVILNQMFMEAIKDNSHIVFSKTLAQYIYAITDKKLVNTLVLPSMAKNRSAENVTTFSNTTYLEFAVNYAIIMDYYNRAKQEILTLVPKYIDFCGKMDLVIPFANKNGSMVVEVKGKAGTPTMRVNLTNCLDHFDSAYVYTDDLGEYAYIPYSMFARKYFEDRASEIPFDRRYIMMRVSAKHNDKVTSSLAYQMRFDLRSFENVSDDVKVCCSDFAKANGGGGHPRAAGFTIDGTIDHNKLF